jgi:hypothetical protein
MQLLGRSLGLLCLVASLGCVGRPLSENPAWIRGDRVVPNCENPVLIAPGDPGPDRYAQVFEKVLDVVDDYFEIGYSNRYDGHIIAIPRIAPGYERLWMAGSPSHRERLLATFQTYRHRCHVHIEAAEPGGYSVKVYVLKDLFDAPAPSRASAPAVFQEANTVDRQFEVVDPFPSSLGERWINKGRDTAFEQAILRKIQQCQ